MKTLLKSLIIQLFALSFANAATPALFDLNYDTVLREAKKGNIESLLSGKNLENLKQLSADERFKIADNLMQEKLIPRNLFYTAKNRPSHVSNLIKSTKTTKKEKPLFRLSLFLISDILVDTDTNEGITLEPVEEKETL